MSCSVGLIPVMLLFMEFTAPAVSCAMVAVTASPVSARAEFRAKQVGC